MMLAKTKLVTLRAIRPCVYVSSHLNSAMDNQEGEQSGPELPNELAVALEMVPQGMMPIFCVLLEKFRCVQLATNHMITYEETIDEKMREFVETARRIDGVCKDRSNDFQVNRSRIKAMETEIKTLRNRVNEQDTLIKSLRKNDAKITKVKKSGTGPVTRSASVSSSAEVDSDTPQSDFHALRSEIDDLAQKCKNYEDKLSQSEKSAAKLQKQIDDQLNELHQQYIFLEDLDGKVRGKNIYISKLPESSYHGLETDAEKIEFLLKDITGTSVEFEFRRAGRPSGTDRPTIVSVKDNYTRNRIVSCFKSSRKDYGDIVLKKDVNPAFRREWRRLYDLERELKTDQPDSDVLFDREKRQVFCDAVKVDYWRPKIVSV